MLMTPETSKKHMECGSIYMTNKYGKVWGLRTLALVFKAATTAAENSRTQNTPSGQYSMSGRVRFVGQGTIKVSKDKSLFYQRGLKNSKKEICYVGEVVG